jgi:hypothetical protein
VLLGEGGRVEFAAPEDGAHVIVSRTDGVKGTVELQLDQSMFGLVITEGSSDHPRVTLGQGKTGPVLKLDDGAGRVLGLLTDGEAPGFQVSRAGHRRGAGIWLLESGQTMLGVYGERGPQLSFEAGPDRRAGMFLTDKEGGRFLASWPE